MGLLTDMLGGLSKGVVDIADQSIARREKERDEERTVTRQKAMADYQLRIQQQAEEFKQRLLEQREVAKSQQLMNQGEQITERGTQIVKGRDTEALNPLRSNMAGDSPLASDAEVQAGLEQLPQAQRAELEAGGFLPKRTATGMIDAQIQAAREIGADTSLRTNLQQQRTSVATEEKSLRDDEFKRWKDGKDHEQRIEEIRTQGRNQLAAIGARTAGGGSGSSKSPAEIKAMTSLDIERSTKAAMNRVARKLGVPLERVNETLTSLSRSGKPLPEGLAEDLAMLDELEGRQMDLERNDPRPSTARGVTPENKPKPDPKTAPPAKGTVQGGYRFKGGDPSKQSNWEKV